MLVHAVLSSSRGYGEMQVLSSHPDGVDIGRPVGSVHQTYEFVGEGNMSLSQQALQVTAVNLSHISNETLRL